MGRARTIATLACLLLAVGSACTIKKMVADNMPGSMDDIKAAFFAESSVRQAREAAPALLMMLDGFVRSSPQNAELLVRAAEMNCSFALGLIERDDPEWASRLYLKGREYAFRVLGQRQKSFPSAVKNFRNLSSLLGKFEKEDAAPLFWAGICWGGYINLNRDDMDAVRVLKFARVIMERVQQLDATYFHGGPHLFLGMYFGGRSQLLGGNPDLAREHFGKVFEITQGRFLLAQVLYAENYAVQIQDRELFEKTLQQVLDAPDDIDPREMLITAISKGIAQKLLDKADELFVQDEDASPAGEEPGASEPGEPGAEEPGAEEPDEPAAPWTEAEPDAPAEPAGQPDAPPAEPDAEPDPAPAGEPDPAPAPDPEESED